MVSGSRLRQLVIGGVIAVLAGWLLYGHYGSRVGPNERIRILDVPGSIPVSTEVTFKLEYINLQESVEYRYAIFIVSPSFGTRDLLAREKLYRPVSEFEGVLTESTYSHQYVHEAKARLTVEYEADGNVFRLRSSGIRTVFAKSTRSSGHLGRATDTQESHP